MRLTVCMFVAMALLTPLSAASDAVGAGKAFRYRYFTAEAPAAQTEEAVLRVTVKLPRHALIPKVQVLADREDHGHEIRAWARCDIETRLCETGDVRIVGFHRSENDDYQELAVDVANAAGEPRFIKLWVSYQARSGQDASDCGVGTECGYSEIVAAN